MRSGSGPSAFRVARKVVVAVIGVSVLALGVALLVLPAPGSLAIALGLAILATEFLWARKLLGQGRKHVRRLKVLVQRVLGKPSAVAVDRCPSEGERFTG